VTTRTVLSVFFGALAGLAYQRVVGCRSGHCPITANPWTSALYGAVVGFIASGGR